MKNKVYGYLSSTKNFAVLCKFSQVKWNKKIAFNVKSIIETTVNSVHSKRVGETRRKKGKLQRSRDIFTMTKFIGKYTCSSEQEQQTQMSKMRHRCEDEEERERGQTVAMNEVRERIID